MATPEGFTIVEQPKEQVGVPEGFTIVEPAPAPAPPQDPRGVVGTAVAGAGEVAAGVNRQLLGLLDFLGPDNINAILQVVGSEKRVPTFGQLAEPKGAFLGPGQAADILGGVGEVAGISAGVGGALRQGAQALSPLARQSESAIRGVLRQAGTTTPAQDILLGGLAGAGQEIGRDVAGEEGALVGSILLPVGGVAAQQGLTKLLNLGGRGITALTSQLSKLSEEGASTLLAEAMVREGLSPSDLAARLQALGPEGIPADIANSFSRLLRVASNEIPRIEGRAAQVLGERQAGQAGRLFAGIDEATGTIGLSVDDEIARMNTVLKPQIDELYATARGNSVPLSARLKELFAGKNSLGRARRLADKRLADKEAAGDVITNIDIIDTTKQELDDQIGTALRQGQNNKVRDLIRLKNVMVEEADAAIPEYAQGRSLFAGKASLENAADAGSQFFKLKPREIEDFVKSMGDSELKMFRLGAKQAIVDRAENLQVNADAVRRLFGKRGDVTKLKSLFPDEQSFQDFSNTLEREANFVLTRRAAQANSTTAKQLIDSGKTIDSVIAARAALGDPIAGAKSFSAIIRGFKAKKGGADFTAALEQAGDILLESGMNPKQLETLLRSGNAPRIRKILENVLIKPSDFVVPVSQVAVAAQLQEGNSQ